MKNVNLSSTHHGIKQLIKTGTSTEFPLHILLLFITGLCLAVKIRRHKWTLVKRKRRDFDSIPGPPGVPVFGNLFDVAWPGLDLSQEAMKAFDKYGGIYKCTIFYNNFCIMSDPVQIQKLLQSTDPGYLNKPKRIYEMILAGNMSLGLISSDYPIWKPHRKVISRLFTVTGIQHQLSSMNKSVKHLIKDMLVLAKENECGNKENVFMGGKVGKMINLTALQNILHILMDMEFASAKEVKEFHENIMIIKNGGSQRILQPWLLLEWIWKLHPLKRSVDRASIETRKFVTKMVEKYRRNMQVKGRAMQSELDEDLGIKPFKCVMEEMLEAGFNEEEIYHEVVTMIAAGHETSSYSVDYLLFRLALNPDIQEKCRKEVDKLFEKKLANDGAVDSSMSLNFSVEDLKGLEYLDRCMKENLRLAPIVPVFGRRLDKPLKLGENLELDTDVIVAVLPWVLHRDPKIYPDPERFDPDRFLPEECEKRHPYAYLPFSAGPRICIGWKVAHLSIKLITALVLRHFVIETPDRWEDLEFVFDISLSTKEKINILLKRRPGIF